MLAESPPGGAYAERFRALRFAHDADEPIPEGEPWQLSSVLCDEREKESLLRSRRVRFFSENGDVGSLE